MSRLRMAAVAAATACAVSLGAAGTASAQEEPAPRLTKEIALTGTNKGKDFTGTYTIQRFTSSGDKVYAVGKLTGKLKNRKVSRSNVRIPATLAVPAEASQAPDPTPGACQVLDLVLNPIDLNLLGLRIATSRIELLIEAIPGGNALLGNLLCALTGILDPQGQSAGTLAAALNSILALLPRTA
jgi:hypothetical protein